MRRPLILCYHTVTDSWPCELAVPLASFAAQMELLARRGYEGLTLKEAECRRQRGSLPRKSVVVTFDDGYKSTVNAVAALDRAGFPATLFVVTDFVDAGKALSWPGIDSWAEGEYAREVEPLTWPELAELRRIGWEVGSHTCTHPLLPAVNDGALRDELERSRARIIEKLDECASLAYPYGAADDRVAAAAAAAGYDVACTTLDEDPVDEPLRRSRVGMAKSDIGLRLRSRLSPVRIRLRRSSVGAAVANRRRR